MEKICIVKRREQYSQIRNKPAIYEESGSSLESEDVTLNIKRENKKLSIGQSLSGLSNSDSANEVSITMTPEQSNMLQESAYVKKILAGTVKDRAFTIQQTPAGQIVLNFHPRAAVNLRMLRTDQVCSMLQISRSLLMRLIHENKIKSYKIGRLRRFLLEDILEYLLSNEEFSTLDGKL
jgi:excisionase family DNA binding protein